MFSIVLALMALVLPAAVALAGWRYFARIRKRLDTAEESLASLQKATIATERNCGSVQQRQTETEQAVATLRSSLKDLETHFVSVEEYAGVCVPPKPSNSGMNINRRVEAVRLLKEGLTEERVAAELALPLSEVRLIAHLEKSVPPRTTKRSRQVA
ncbi:MAG: hypothetical protein LC114_20060 [Bryobacterales bacterium]|nr:hypothetical protein [Bryobacterales bacterium]